MGCSNAEDEQTKQQEKEKEEEVFENIYPLTGIETNEPVNNRIIGVMVNNHTAARPQSGLSQADIVFEILAEGNITRFLALFHSNIPEVVGPVRSAREYYFNLANDYNALYVYHGAADFINDMIVNRGINFLNGAHYDNDGHLFKRESFRKAPHNSYLQIGNVYEKAADKGYAVETDYESLLFLTEDEIEALTGEEAQSIQVVYSPSQPSFNVQYEYQPETGSYTRMSNGELTEELDTRVPIEVENVLIMETTHQIIDDQGRRAVDMQTGGNAYLLQKGMVQNVQWENRNGRIVPVKDGQEVGLVPGQTWINVVPSNPGIEQSVSISNS